LERIILNLISKVFLWIYKKSTEERFDLSNRKLPLKELIARSEKRMRIKPVCPHCNTEMKFRASQVVEGNVSRDDIAYKCPNCFHTAHFGIPITGEEVRNEIDLRGSHQLLRPTAFKLDEDEEIKKRLRDLGYLL
jgi:hypothetical protein